jgi:hypothetical protein
LRIIGEWLGIAVFVALGGVISGRNEIWRRGPWRSAISGPRVVLPDREVPVTLRPRDNRVEILGK